MEQDLKHLYPYSVKLSENAVSYEFLTENNIQYKIAFDDISDMGIEGMYSFSLVKISNETKADGRVKYTIIDIFKNFFRCNKHSVFYLCDIADKKEKARHRLFNLWFLSDDFHYKLIKINEKITVNEQSYYMSIIYGKDNPNEDSIKQFYTLNIDQLKEK